MLVGYGRLLAYNLLLNVLNEINMGKTMIADGCPAAAALNVISGKWKIYILGLLFRKPQRFTEMSESIDGISHKVLTQTLKELEEDGLIERRLYDEMPVRVEYALTEMGLQLRPLLLSMVEWGSEYLENKKISSKERAQR